MTPKKPDWFELTENGDSYAGIQKINKKLPIATLVVAGAVILGGSIFANANNEQTAVAETPATSQSVAVQASSPSALTTSAQVTSGSSGVNSLPLPTVTNVPQRGEDDEHEGRERGGRERDHDDDDDDRDDDDRHEDEDED
jgi:hypothetical protein